MHFISTRYKAYKWKLFSCTSSSALHVNLRARASTTLDESFNCVVNIIFVINNNFLLGLIPRGDAYVCRSRPQRIAQRIIKRTTHTHTHTSCRFNTPTKLHRRTYEIVRRSQNNNNASRAPASVCCELFVFFSCSRRRSCASVARDHRVVICHELFDFTGITYR